MLHVFLLGSGEDQDVIQVNKHKVIDKVSEDVIYLGDWVVFVRPNSMARYS